MKKKPKEEIIIMEKKKSYGVLIAGAILLILGIILAGTGREAWTVESLYV